MIWLFVLASCIAAFVAIRPMARGEKSLPEFATFVLFALFIGLAAFAAAIGVFACGYRLFALIRIVYFALAIVVPSAGLMLLIRCTRANQKSRLAFALSVLLLIPAPLAAYASWIEPRLLVLESATLPNADVFEPAGLRIVVIADLQTDRIGTYERDCFQRINELKPDLVLMTGDYLQVGGDAYHRAAEALRPLLRDIDAPLGTYAVCGDVEHPRWARQLFADTGVQLMENDVLTIQHAGKQIAIGGLELRCDSRDAKAGIDRLARTAADYRILIAHRPDVIFVTRDSDNIDLIVAGHTHGGRSRSRTSRARSPPAACTNSATNTSTSAAASASNAASRHRSDSSASRN